MGGQGAVWRRLESSRSWNESDWVIEMGTSTSMTMVKDGRSTTDPPSDDPASTRRGGLGPARGRVQEASEASEAS